MVSFWRNFQSKPLFFNKINHLHKKEPISLGHFINLIFFFLTKLGKIFVQQFLCFQSGKRFYNKDSDQILAYQPFKSLCHCLIAVLIISAYKKDIFCSYSKKQTGKKLKAHSIHPLDIIQKKNDLIILCDLSAHLYSN